MSKTPEEARGRLEPLIDQYAKECADIQGRPYPAKLAILDAADAYALAAHVATCEAQERRVDRTGAEMAEFNENQITYHRCGDGWYCDGAKRYIKEERSASRA